MKTPLKHFRINDEDEKLLEQRAAKLNVSKSEMIRQLIRKGNLVEDNINHSEFTEDDLLSYLDAIIGVTVGGFNNKQEAQMVVDTANAYARAARNGVPWDKFNEGWEE